jgi:uncharacterized protein YaaN involved in tellurite resistance
MNTTDIAPVSKRNLEKQGQLVKAINVYDSKVVSTFGIDIQSGVSDFSRKFLSSAKTRDFSEISDGLTNLIISLKNPKPTGGLFSRFKDKANQIKAMSDTVEQNITVVSSQLQNSKDALQQDIGSLDQFAELNQKYYNDLTDYIEAGRIKLNQEREALAATQTDGMNEYDLQVLSFKSSMLGNFDKKLSDLELSRAVLMQNVPQIKMLQAADFALMDKIQSTLTNTIPLWRSQCVMSLMINTADAASKLQEKVSDFTNKLLQDNATTLKTSVTRIAKESERAIVDIDTVKKTNEALIQTIEDITSIHREGLAQRKIISEELQRIEVNIQERLRKAIENAVDVQALPPGSNI